jgi:hypothetical protein
VDAVPIIISLLALAIAAYGILERKELARRLERIRLSELLDSLNQVSLELARTNERSGTSIVALNTRNELLAQQVSSILPKFEQEVTSAELRTLAHGLAHANYWEDAELVGNGQNLLLEGKVLYNKSLGSGAEHIICLGTIRLPKRVQSSLKCRA